MTDTYSDQAAQTYQPLLAAFGGMSQYGGGAPGWLTPIQSPASWSNLDFLSAPTGGFVPYDIQYVFGSLLASISNLMRSIWDDLEPPAPIPPRIVKQFRGTFEGRQRLLPLPIDTEND
jgi:hypothetical protein